MTIIQIVKSLVTCCGLLLLTLMMHSVFAVSPTGPNFPEELSHPASLAKPVSLVKAEKKSSAAMRLEKNIPKATERKKNLEDKLLQKIAEIEKLFLSPPTLSKPKKSTLKSNELQPLLTPPATKPRQAPTKKAALSESPTVPVSSEANATAEIRVLTTQAADSLSSQIAAAQLRVIQTHRVVRRYIRFEYPQQLRQIESELKLTRLKVFQLQTRAKRLSEQDRAGTMPIFPVSSDQIRYYLAQAQFELRQLKAERSELVRSKAVRYHLLKRLYLQAVAELRSYKKV